MGRVPVNRVLTLLLLASTSGCSSGGSHLLPAITAPATSTTVSTTTSTTTSIVASPASVSSPDTSQPEQPEASWTGTMNSSSNYTVTASDGGLVCAGTWVTTLKLTVASDGTVTGTATSTLDGAPVCVHPEFLPTPVTTMFSNITGTANASQLQVQLTHVSYEPADGIDTTGMAASVYGFNSPSTITIPIATPRHAEGSQQLQFVSAVNAYTSDNTFALDCQTC